MTFELVENPGRGNKSVNVPWISLRKSGVIGINQIAAERWLDRPKYVHVLFDESENRIGIQPVEQADENTYMVGNRDNRHTLQVSPSAFLRRAGLVPERTTRYRATWDDENGMLVGNLNVKLGTFGKSTFEVQQERKREQERERKRNGGRDGTADDVDGDAGLDALMGDEGDDEGLDQFSGDEDEDDEEAARWARKRGVR